MPWGGGKAAAACAVCFGVVFIALSCSIYLIVFDLTPVEVTVDEASLGRLALATPASKGTALLSYNLSLAVAVHNPSWSTRAWRTSPLEAELRFRGRPFDRRRPPRRRRVGPDPRAEEGGPPRGGGGRARARGPRELRGRRVRQGARRRRRVRAGARRLRRVQVSGPQPAPPHQGDLPAEALAAGIGGGVREGRVLGGVQGRRRLDVIVIIVCELQVWCGVFFVQLSYDLFDR